MSRLHGLSIAGLRPILTNSGCMEFIGLETVWGSHSTSLLAPLSLCCRGVAEALVNIFSFHPAVQALKVSPLAFSLWIGEGQRVEELPSLQDRSKVTLLSTSTTFRPYWETGGADLRSASIHFVSFLADSIESCQWTQKPVAASCFPVGTSGCDGIIMAPVVSSNHPSVL